MRGIAMAIVGATLIWVHPLSWEGQATSLDFIFSCLDGGWFALPSHSS
jgi:hypothetical protein